MIPDQSTAPRAGITLRGFLLGLFFAGLFAHLTVYWENIAPTKLVTAAQIPVLPYILLIGVVLLVNPLLRWARGIRPLSAAELMVIFIMGMVSSGISTFGLASHLVPVVSSLYNGHWNNDQSRWDLYLEPYVKERFFISEPGIQAAAVEFRDADRAFRATRQRLYAAKGLEVAQTAIEHARARLLEAGAEAGAKRWSLERQVRMAERNLTQATTAWEQHDERLDLTAELAALPAQLAELEVEQTARQAELDALKAKAFAKVEVFRRGLPDELRAIPGFIYVADEGVTAYFARVRRLLSGLSALGHLKQANAELTRAVAAGEAPALGAYLDEAVGKLEPVAAIPALSQRRKELQREIEAQKERLEQVGVRLRQLNRQRRSAPGEELDDLDDEIAAEGRREKRLQTDLGELNEELGAIDPQLAVSDRVGEAVTSLTALKEQAATAGPGDAAQMQAELQRIMATFNAFDASFRRFLVGDVDWRIWLKPLLNWGLLIFLTYIVLMTFNVLIFRQWAYNEKLMYPLAELPVALAGGGGEGEGTPPLYLSGIFWLGFGISAFVLGWNVMVAKQLIPGLKPIPLSYSWTEYVQGSIFEGLAGQTRFHVFFTLIGLTFLVPARISHSLWFCHILYMVQLLLLVWLGYGINAWSFRPNWNTVLNFRTAEGGGALIVFGLVVLWKCRHYLFCFARPEAVHGLPADERTELRVSSFLFVFGSAALVIGLTLGLGVNIVFAASCYLLMLLITIGLVRAVAEGGLLSLKMYFSPFHVLRSVFGMDKSWTSPALFAPLTLYYVILFVDLKTFIAPAMANALKIRDDLKMRRWRFHTAVIGCIICAVVVALLTHIILGYEYGGDNMRKWFYTHFPKRAFTNIKDLAMTTPTDVRGCRYWLMFGALLMGGLLYGRRRVFWLPHPIGLVMFVNPLLHTYWGSILIGWFCKATISKYGNKGTYQSMRKFFIGLIAGELVLCLFGATLNR